MKRKGQAKGKGKGYKNLPNFPKDPKIHSDSSKGRKQPQRIPQWSRIAGGYQINNKTGEVRITGKYGFFGKVHEDELKRQTDSDSDGVPDHKDCDPNDPTKQADSKIFHINPNIEIVAHYEKTRNGFRHIAVLYVDGQEVDRAKQTYLNRTWESYEFETAIRNLLDMTGYLTEEEKQEFLDSSKRKDREEVDSRFRSIGAVAQLGEVFGKTQKEKNDWKKRMLQAGLSQLDIPEDWDKLSESEKEKRLDKVIELMKGDK